MNKETFSKRHGFKSYEHMLLESTSVIFDNGVNYYLTLTPRGWMAWIDIYLETPLGWFSSFAEGQLYLTTLFQEYENYPPRYPLVSDVEEMANGCYS